MMYRAYNPKFKKQQALKDNKYHARKVVAYGQTFDSEKEYARYLELKLLEKAGEISGLRMQVEYVLIPEQRGPYTIGKRGGMKKGELIERKCSYVADFVYKENGETVVEDVKGMRLQDYKINQTVYDTTPPA